MVASKSKNLIQRNIPRRSVTPWVALTRWSWRRLSDATQILSYNEDQDDDDRGDDDGDAGDGNDDDGDHEDKVDFPDDSCSDCDYDDSSDGDGKRELSIWRS